MLSKQSLVLALMVVEIKMQSKIDEAYPLSLPPADNLNLIPLL